MVHLVKIRLLRTYIHIRDKITNVDLGMVIVLGVMAVAAISFGSAWMALDLPPFDDPDF